MFYREAGDFSTTYPHDSQTFRIRFDRYRYYFVLAFAFLVVPFIINDYWANAILLPFLIYAIAAIGLNILTGYCGQVSLGTGGFMAVGAYACYKFMTGVDIWWPNSEGEMELLFRLPQFNIALSVLMGGVVTAVVGVLFGLPSLRIKGFYLAVATLAAQFFLVWVFNRVPWFYNYSASGQSARLSVNSWASLSLALTHRPGQPICSASSLWCLSASSPATWHAARWGAPGWRSAIWISLPRSSG